MYTICYLMYTSGLHSNSISIIIIGKNKKKVRRNWVHWRNKNGNKHFYCTKYTLWQRQILWKIKSYNLKISRPTQMFFYSILVIYTWKKSVTTVSVGQYEKYLPPSAYCPSLRGRTLTSVFFLYCPPNWLV